MFMLVWIALILFYVALIALWGIGELVFVHGKHQEILDSINKIRYHKPVEIQTADNSVVYGKAEIIHHDD